MNIKIKKILEIVLSIVIFFGAFNTASAASINLTVRDGDDVVFIGDVPLPTGITSLNDANGTPRAINPNSVLAALGSVSSLPGSGFTISNLTYFDSFGSLYLKCITATNGEKCDDWQYTVGGIYPSVGMDQNILSGGENIYVYFGPQNKIILSSNSIDVTGTLTATAEKYDYQNNMWRTRTGVNVGLTQPDPNNTFSPIEIQTKIVDTNGQAVFSSIPVGSYNVGIKEDYYFPTETLTVTDAGSSQGSSSRASSAENFSLIKTKFDLAKAFEFLISQQKENGAFGEDLYTDWTALALASGNNQNQVLKLVKFFQESKIESTLLTDYERRAMALMALGLNPYNTNGENYISKIVFSFDDKQFGDANEDNDDIFALMVLQKAGFKPEEKMINADIAFILSRQKADGSFDGSVDMTGAAMEVLAFYNQNEQDRLSDPHIGEVKIALEKAKSFLKQNQKDNGGWEDNASSTAWAMEGILSIGEKPEDWIKNNPASNGTGNTPVDYLASLQDKDGGILAPTTLKNPPAGENDNNIKTRLWETAYAVSALSGKTWMETMQNFKKQEITLKTTPKSLAIKKTAGTTSGLEKKIIHNIANEISATAIKAVTLSTSAPEATTEVPVKKNWFRRIVDTIFSIF